MPADRPHTISINHKNYESTDTWRLVHGAVIARRRRCCDGEIMDLKTTMMSWYLSDILPLEMLLLSRHTHQNESLQIWENNPFFSVISLTLSGRIRRHPIIVPHRPARQPTQHTLLRRRWDVGDGWACWCTETKPSSSYEMTLLREMIAEWSVETRRTFLRFKCCFFKS